MNDAHIWLTTFKTINLQYNRSKETSAQTTCHVKWRHKILWVGVNEEKGLLDLPALKSEWWLLNCLKKSPVEKICLSPQLDVNEAATWAKTGQVANKKVFLRIMPHRSLFLLQHSLAWTIKRTVDFVMALFLLLLSSPIMLLFIAKQKLAGQPIFVKRQCIGKKGLIFETLQFSQESSAASSLSINKLPQLINVLRGEMSFIGRYSYSLEEALVLNDQQRKILNVVPGIMGAYYRRNSKTNPVEIFLQDREYLAHWSLGSDIKILLLNLPLVLFPKLAFRKAI